MTWSAWVARALASAAGPGPIACGLVEPVRRAPVTRSPATAEGDVAGDVADVGVVAGEAGDGADGVDVAGALGGDEQAYARLVRRHQAGVARQMWRFTRDRGVLEELVQEVFVQAWFSLPRYRADAPLTHWLARIAVRVGYGYWRQRSRDGRVTPLGAAAGASLAEVAAGGVDGLEAREAAELVHRALAALSPADRLVVTLMHLEQRSVRETAALTGWSRPAVKVRAMRARRRLARVLTRNGWS
ncbi:MAG: RNA polymerase sigma factor [Phycisphaeraceae bacterium]